MKRFSAVCVRAKAKAVVGRGNFLRRVRNRPSFSSAPTEFWWRCLRFYGSRFPQMLSVGFVPNFAKVSHIQKSHTENDGADSWANLVIILWGSFKVVESFWQASRLELWGHQPYQPLHTFPVRFGRQRIGFTSRSFSLKKTEFFSFATEFSLAWSGCVSSNYSGELWSEAVSVANWDWAVHQCHSDAYKRFIFCFGHESLLSLNDSISDIQTEIELSWFEVEYFRNGWWTPTFVPPEERLYSLL